MQVRRMGTIESSCTWDGIRVCIAIIRRGESPDPAGSRALDGFPPALRPMERKVRCGHEWHRGSRYTGKNQDPKGQVHTVGKCNFGTKYIVNGRSNPGFDLKMSR